MNSLHNKILLVITLCLSFMLTGCSGCSKSGLREKPNEGSYSSNNHSRSSGENSRNSQGKTIVKMENNNGVKYIWVEINGLKLKFIFDTGASSICISSAEASVLYRQGTLQKSDIFDIQYFQDATGTISAGTKIKLNTVQIGDRTLYNIEGIVIDNTQAPLLLGQSVLEKFGKISIDNTRAEITFE